MKAWVQSLTATQYLWLGRTCNVGPCVGSLIALFVYQNWYVWAALFAFQMVSCYLISQWRDACNTCNQKYCLRHLNK